MALPQRGGHFCVHVGEVAPVTGPGKVPGPGQPAADAAQNPAGARRPGSHLVPQGQPVLHVLRCHAVRELPERVPGAHGADGRRCHQGGLGGEAGH